MCNGEILDTAYVVYAPDNDTYYTSNRGLYVTERNAQKECDLQNRVYNRNCKVLKVNLVVVED